MSVATARGIGLLVVAAIIFMAGHHVNGWRLGKEHAEYREAAALALVKQQQLAQARTEYHIAEMALLDRRHTQEMADAQVEIDQLRTDVADGRRRLSVSATCEPAVPADSTAPGMDDAASPRLTDAAERDYWNLRHRIVRTTAQLTGLQEYVKGVCLNGR